MSRGKHAAVYDCGPLGRLTVREIAVRAGVTCTSVYNRLHRGLTGEALLARPSTAAERYRHRQSDTYRAAEWRSAGRCSAYIAARIAARYRNKAPTVKQLTDDFGMSRATAYRWRSAFMDAYGEHASGQSVIRSELS